MLPFFKLLQRELRARIGEAEKRSAMSINSVCTYASSFGPPSFTWPSQTMATTVTQRHFVRIKGHNMPSILSTTPIAEHVKLHNTDSAQLMMADLQFFDFTTV